MTATNLPDNIVRRSKDGPSKLITELKLYESLYRESRAKPIEGEPSGVPIYEIRMFTDASVRSLSRYLRDLEDCGAVTRAAWRKKYRYCLAEVEPVWAYMTAGSPKASPRLLRLSRTVGLMKLWIDEKEWAMDICEDYHRNYSKAFFASLAEAERWYETHGIAVSPRTIQRDLQTLWDALDRPE